MNKTILMGRLTADPQMRTTQSAKQVATFTVAVNRRFAREGQQQADFINCVAWEKTAEFIGKYFKKGNMIAIDGRIQTRVWETEQGEKRYVTEVIVENAYFTGEKSQSDTTTATPHNDWEDIPQDNEDLPF